MRGAALSIGRNLRRWRLTREMTLSALAEQAGVAKSTVSMIERGRGNPSIETVEALASALGVPFSSLIIDEPPGEEVSIVREAEGRIVGVDEKGPRRGGHVARRMLTRTGGELIEIYSLELEEGVLREANGHASGRFEHIVVTDGSVEISAGSFSEILHRGDLISFRADRPHSYRAVEGPVRLVSVHEYPHGSPASPPAGSPSRG